MLGSFQRLNSFGLQRLNGMGVGLLRRMRKIFYTLSQTSVTQTAGSGGPTTWCLDALGNRVLRTFPTGVAIFPGKFWAETVADGATLGNNIVSNSDFAATGSWSPRAGWIIAGDGKATAAAGTTTNLDQALVLQVGTRYKATLIIDEYVTGPIRIFAGSVAATSPDYTAPGTYTFEFVAESTSLYAQPHWSFCGTISYFDARVVSPRFLDNLPTVPVVQSIACWGDSMTDGFGQTPFTDLFPDSTFKDVYNGGVDGETSTQIKTRFDAAPSRHGDVSIFWVGRNNWADPVQIKADLAAMVADLWHDKYLMINMMAAAYEDEPFEGAKYNAILQFNIDLEAIYGGHYVDLRNLIANSYDPNNPQDVLDYARNLPPSSLRYDEGHLNAAGNALVASFLNTELLARGYISNSYRTTPCHPTYKIEGKTFFHQYDAHAISTALVVDKKVNKNGHWYNTTEAGTTGATTPLATPSGILGERFANASFNGDTDWLKQAGWTVAATTAVATNVAAGLAIYQNVMPVDSYVRFDYKINSCTAGGFAPFVNGATAPLLGKTNWLPGVYTDTLRIPADAINGNAGLMAQFDATSGVIEYCTATEVDVNGNRVVRDGTAVLAYGGLYSEHEGGLLTEPASQNYSIFSNLLSSASFVLRGTATDSVYTENTELNTHYCRWTDQPTGTRVISGFFKTTASNRYLLLGNNQLASTNYAIFDIKNGIVIEKGTSAIGCGIQQTPDGLWFCWVSATSTEIHCDAMFLNAPNSSGITYTGDGVSNFTAKEIQVEMGLVPTSRIRTTGAPVARTASIVAAPIELTIPKSGNDFWMLIQGEVTPTVGEDSYLFYAAGSDSGFYVYFNSTGTATIKHKVAGVSTYISKIIGITPGIKNNLTLVIKKSSEDGVKICGNGSAIGSDLTLTPPITNLAGNVNFGSHSGTVNFCNACISTAVFLGQLTDADMLALADGTKTPAEVL